MNPEDLSGFSGRIPIFPLPNIVLFPKMLLPLHIFEPRYRAMTKDALHGERLIAMALLKPGWEQDYYGNPSVHEVIGVGRIVRETQTEDGRYNFLLFGLKRARILKEEAPYPYRSAHVQVLEDQDASAGTKGLEKKRLHLLAVYMSLVEKISKDPEVRMDPDTPVSTVCDMVTAMIDCPIEDKQQVLEQLDVESRLDLVLQLLKRNPLVTEKKADRGTGWPPKTSLN